MLAFALKEPSLNACLPSRAQDPTCRPTARYLLQHRFTLLQQQQQQQGAATASTGQVGVLAAVSTVLKSLDFWTASCSVPQSPAYAQASLH